MKENLKVTFLTSHVCIIQFSCCGEDLSPVLSFVLKWLCNLLSVSLPLIL
jgi:hypothetical protein